MSTRRHLPEAGDTCRHDESLEVVRQEVLRLVRNAWSRAYERHVATQDVHELWELVEARLPQPAAGTGDARAAVELVNPGGRRRGVRRHGLLDVLAVVRLVRVDRHRPELQGGELAQALAQACLPKEDRAVGAFAD